MATNKTVINALNTLTPRSGGNVTRVDQLFGDQPDVLDAIIDARKRRCSFRQISMTLSTPTETISPGAIQSWLAARGIK